MNELKIILLSIAIGSVVIFCTSGFVHSFQHPELTQMQVFKYLIGL